MIGLARGLITLVLLVLFIAMTLATFSRRRRAAYEEAARMPLEDTNE